MRPTRACQRIARRVLLAIGVGLGLMLVNVTSCSDQILQAAFASLQDLTLQIVQIGFDSLEFDWEQTTDGGTDGGSGEITSRAISDLPSWSVA